MKYVGLIEIDEQNRDEIYLKNEHSFLCKKKSGKESLMDKKALYNWAVLLNSPWSQDLFGFDISLNCEDSFTEIKESEPKWKCEYFSIGYDGITAYCIGYGNTEIEALTDCKNLLETIQKQYNPEGIQI